MSVEFIIEGKTFQMPDNFAELDSFIIKSVPKNYNVTLKNSPDILAEIQGLIDENKNNLLLIDKNVHDLYFKSLRIHDSRVFIAEATEEFKTLNGFEEVIDFLTKNEFTKGEKLIVIGGGIIQDIGAFVGACYKRGINWIYYPTTLLSMCDSCIGGKTGINHNRVKNQLALFSAPREVIININFLKTLSEFDIKSGMGEILKLLVTGGKEPLKIYENEVINGRVKGFNSYKPLILSALSVKRAIVEEDEFELYHRKSLNYGHTVGHAIEVLSDYKIPHGQAVILGMMVVNKLAKNRRILNNNDFEFIQKLSEELLGEKQSILMNGLDKLLKKDKKTEGNLVNFVIIAEPGDTRFLKLELDENLIQEIENAISVN